MLKWIIVAISFYGDIPTNSKIFTLDPETFATEEACKTEAAGMVEYAKIRGVDVWAHCAEVKRPEKEEKPKGEPGTDQKS